MQLRESVASSCRIDGIESAVLCFYDREDALGSASCHNSLIPLYLHGRGSATAIRARGLVVIRLWFWHSVEGLWF